MRSWQWHAPLIAVVFMYLGVPRVFAQTDFKIAHWNIRSGHGKSAIDGGNNNVFVTGPNCQTNAWGVGVVQQQLIDNVRNDSQVVALVLNEAYGGAAGCAQIHDIRMNVLRWRSGQDMNANGVAVAAKYGFATTPVWLAMENTGSLTQHIGRVSIWIDEARTQQIEIYATHINSMDVNGTQVINFMAPSRAGNRPHILAGDLNTRSAVGDCGSIDHGDLDRLLDIGYVDAWAHVNPGQAGYTSTVNKWGEDRREGRYCGVPDGAAYKRIDYFLTRGHVSPIQAELFANVTPGDDSPSDHLGLKATFRLGSAPPTDTAAPTVSFEEPASDIGVSLGEDGPPRPEALATISISASDNVAVTRVDFFVDGTLVKTWNSAPYTTSWRSTASANGRHTLRAEARDAAGNTAAATRTLTASNARPPAAVTWSGLVNTTANGAALAKAAGCTTCADAGAFSTEQLVSGDGHVQFTPSTGHRFYAGLGTDRTSGTDPARIDYAFGFWADGGWDIREKGVYRAEGTFVAGDVFSVGIEGGVVKYYRNGALVYTSTVPPTFPLGLDTSLLTVGSSVSNAVLVR